MQRDQSGSILIKVALVMAIVALFITLTVKGREMVENSQSNKLANNFRAIQQALYDLQLHSATSANGSRHADKRGARGKWTSDIALDNQGIANLLNPSLNEPFYIWQQLQGAGPLRSASRSRVSGYAPLDLSKGSVNTSSLSNAPIQGMDGEHIICSDNISGRLVRQLDMMLDDGYTARGSMLVSYANSGGEPIPSDNIIERDFYLACLSV